MIRTLLAPLLAVALLGVTSPAAAAQPWDELGDLARLRATSPRLRVESRPGYALPVGLSPLAAGPFEGEPLAAARAFLAAYPQLLGCPLGELRPRLILPIGAPDPGGWGPLGATVRFTQESRGIPFDGDAAVVRLGPGGRVRALRQRCQRALGDAAPTLSAEDAARLARALAPVGDAPGATLVYWGRGEVARLTWRVEGAAAPGAAPAAVLLDAHTGALREVRALSDAAGPVAQVYLHNPFVDEGPEDVELAEGTGDGLEGPRATVYQCRDQGALYSCRDADGRDWSCHLCSYSTAAGPEGGAYLYEPVPFPEVPVRDEDDFVAPQVYYTVNAGMAWFGELGLSAFAGEPFTLLVNTRYPNALDAAALEDPAAPLGPLDNAYYQQPYTNAQGQAVPASLVFGQGEVTDFGYDADVIYHELSHGVVFTLGGPRGLTFDARGLSLEPAALNEAFSDYFSSAIQGDPNVGEYAALLWDETGGGVRDLAELRTCPADLTGQQHNDSQVFSGALWALRSGLDPADRPTLDAVVFGVLSSLSGYASISEASSAVVDAVGEDMGEDARAAAEAAFDERGALSCARVLPVTPQGLEERVLRSTPVSPPRSLGVSEPAPANVQLRLELPPGTWRITARFVQAQYKGVPLTGYGFDRTPQPVSVVARLGQPITWSLSPDEDGDAVLSHSGEDVADAALLPDLEPLNSDTHTYPWYEASWLVEDAPGGAYYLQLANAGSGTAWIYEVSLDVADAQDEVGCGRSGGRCEDSGAGAALLLGVALWARRRRRED